MFHRQQPIFLALIKNDPTPLALMNTQTLLNHGDDGYHLRHHYH